MKYRRRHRKTRQTEVSEEDVPLSMTPNVSILDAFEDAFDDNDDGFTTIKDLAERGITKMEPLDYDDFYLGAYDNETLREHMKNETNFEKEENDDTNSNRRIKDEPPDDDVESTVTKSDGARNVDKLGSNEKYIPTLRFLINVQYIY